MASASNYLENQIIDHIFRAGTFTKPSALYIALYTSATSDAGGGTEVNGGGYARAQLNPSNSNWTSTQGGTSGASSGTGGSTSNAVAITYEAPTDNWGTITHIGILDSLSGGNLLAHGALTNPKTVNNGDPAPTFPIGAIVLSVA